MFSFLYIIIGIIIGIYQVVMSYFEGLRDRKELSLMFVTSIFLWLPVLAYLKVKKVVKKGK